ncbi:MAG: hypothetical protein KBT20_11185 [Bacteroidales bacterium]|nr:hypothetical protein [Candidatus Liminaster caballi]
MFRRSVAFIFILFLSLAIVHGQTADIPGHTDDIIAQVDDVIERVDADDMNETQYLRYLEQAYNDTLLDSHMLVVQSNLSDKADQSYLGDMFHHTIRYRCRLSNDSLRRVWNVGFVLDKDAGERFDSRAPFADSYSVYASFESTQGWLRQAMIGNYRVTMGLGLLCNQSFALGKNMATQSMMTGAKPFAVHSSASEDDYMLGAAMRIRLGRHVEVLPFVSARPIDGRLEHDTLMSWSTGGYHRTSSELSRRHTSWITNAGGSVRVFGEWYRVSANVLYTQLQHTYWRPLRAYNNNVFRGHDLLQFSLDYEALWMGMHLKGETAVDDRGGLSSVNAIQGNVFEDWSVTAIYRYYGDTYRQLLGNSIAESSAMQGETGVSVCVDGALTRNVGVSLSADWFHFSQPVYSIYQPSSGYELSAKFIFKPSSSRSSFRQASLSYRIKSKYRNNTLTATPTDDITPYYRHTINAHSTWQLPIGLTLKSQVRTRLYSAQNTGGVQMGYAASQAVGWHSASDKVRADVQATYFHTDDYDTRLYLSEKNLLYGFSIPMLYGEGERYSMVIHYRPVKRFTIETKYDITTCQRQGLGLTDWRLSMVAKFTL